SASGGRSATRAEGPAPGGATVSGSRRTASSRSCEVWRGEACLPRSRLDRVPLLLKPVAQEVVALELLQRKRTLGPLGVLRCVDGFEQQLDLVARHADPELAPVLHDLGDRIRGLLLKHPRSRSRAKELLRPGQ